MLRKGLIGATPPRGSDHQARHSFQGEAQDDLVGRGAEQMDHHLGISLDHLCCGFEQPQAQRVELRHPPGRSHRQGTLECQIL